MRTRIISAALSPLMIIACIAVVLGLGTAAIGTPYFLLESASEWIDAKAEGKIQSMESYDWTGYMAQWDAFHDEDGEPYPENTFIPAEMPTGELYVYPGEGGGGGGGMPEDAGLVMVWGREPLAPGSYSSAWRYDYGLDPDLSNVTITLTVTAPQFDALGNQINVVSFGIQDINGNIRAWYWNVGTGQPIPWNVPTTISINTSLVGLGAATPAATGFANNPACNLVNAQFLIVDENATWVGGPMPAPPPGGFLPGLWNYWHNISVTPNPPPKWNDPTKWSQPPVEWQPGLEPPVYLGWDEYSMYNQGPPIVADDWKCTNDNPVTDIHWWGSFIGWDQPNPPQLPSGFHIAIWTDVPAGVNGEFSHPGQIVWENFCTTYEWNYAGYDHDPRIDDPEMFREACFQFNQRLTPDEYFYQDPGPEGNIYWLSIAAIYDQPTTYPWGWKTRPHFFNDDAVRIQQVTDPAGLVGWPPHKYWSWSQGQPIEYPEGISWDLAFELTTIEHEENIDWGDAPDPLYPTLAANNGASHVIVPNLFLGALIDGEPDGQPDPNALGDDNNGVDDEDGVIAATTLVPGQPATVTIVASAPGMLDAWLDYNADGSWIGDQVFASQPIAAGTNTLTFVVPATALPGNTFARLRFSSLGGLSYDGPAPDGEVEDYQVTIEAPQIDTDWGDAPDPLYPTLSANNGASHVIVPGFMLGALIDSELDGQPDPNALGDDNNGIDDEDGVVFVTPFIEGKTAVARVTASVNGLLDVWMDYNGDGDWTDAGDQIAASAAVTAGNNNWVYIGSPQAGLTTYMRFRFSSTGGLAPTGPATDGEVEDYQITVEPKHPSKWLQPPDLMPTGMDVNAMQPMVMADDFMCMESGPITFIRVWGSWYKDISPSETNMPDFILSIHEDIPGNGQEYSRPGRVLWTRNFVQGMNPGEYLMSPWAEGLQEGWFDPPTQQYDPNGDTICWKCDFQIPYEEAFIQRGTQLEPKVYWLDVQAIDKTGNPGLYRFGWKTSMQHWNDDAVWGQGVEPYPGPWNELRYPIQHPMHGDSIDLAFELRTEDMDYGDAPDPTYPTLLASSGASHDIVPGICLGATVDRDPDGQPDPNALGDDNNGIDDEDGVTFLTPIVPNTTAYIDVVASVPGILSGWIDFNGDGDWDDADDYLWISSANAGSNVFGIWVPATAQGGRDTYARFRFGVLGGWTGPRGHSTDGEVEDYKVYIQPNPAVVTKGTAKLLPLGSYVLIERNIVTANFGQIGWYFEEPDRSAGLGVFPLPSVPISPWQIDDRVSCYGTTTLIGSELMLQEIYSWQEGRPGHIDPVGQNNRSSGGGVFGNQPGLMDNVGTSTSAYGLNTVALLVKLWGRCTYIENDVVDPSVQLNFWIDDGSASWDGTYDPLSGAQVLGVKVRIPSNLPEPIEQGRYYTAVGIMRTETPPLSLGTRWLWPRDENDIMLIPEEPDSPR